MERDRRAHPRQQPRRRRLRRADRARRSRSRSSASRACCGCPRSPRSSPRSTLLQDLTANADAAQPAQRPALGDRPARPGAARAAGRAALAGGGAARSRGRPSPRSSAERSRAPTRPRCRPSATRSPTPATCPTPRGARAVRAARRRAAHAARARRGAAARPRPPHHRHHRHRRRARLVGQRRRPRPGATTSTCSSRRWPSSRPIDGQVTLPSLLAWLRPRTRWAAASTSRHAVRGRLGQAADRAPRQGARVVLGVPGRGVRREVPGQPGRARSGRPSGKVLPAPLRGDAADVPAAARLRQAGDRRAHRRGQGAPGRRGAAARLRRLHPGQARAVGLVVPVEPDRQKPLGPSPYQQTVREAASSRLGLAARPVADKPGGRRRQPAARATSPSVPWPVTERTAEHERRLGGGRARAGGDGRPTPVGRRRDELDIVEAARVAGVGRRARAAARRGAGRPVRRRRRAAARRACRPPRWPGCATTPSGSPRDLARPMPRQPSPAARFGTRFHAWVEARFGQQSLLDPDDLPGRGDLGIDDEDDLRELIAALRVGPVRRPGPARGRAAVRAGAGRPGGARPHRRGVRRARRRLPGRRLEDQPASRPPTRSSSRSTGSPGPSSPGAARAGPRRLPLRAHRGDRRSPTDLPDRPSSGGAADRQSGA